MSLSSTICREFARYSARPIEHFPRPRTIDGERNGLDGAIMRGLWPDWVEMA